MSSDVQTAVEALPSGFLAEKAGTLKAVAQMGYQVRVYIPFGDAWYPYFMRRLAERPANLFFMARAFFGG